MRRWERNGCAVHAELPFRFSVICNNVVIELSYVTTFHQNTPFPTTTIIKKPEK